MSDFEDEWQLEDTEQRPVVGGKGIKGPMPVVSDEEHSGEEEEEEEGEEEDEEEGEGEGDEYGEELEDVGYGEHPSTGGKRPRPSTGGKGLFHPTTGGKGLPDPKRPSPARMLGEDSPPAFEDDSAEIAALRTSLEQQQQQLTSALAEISTLKTEVAGLKSMRRDSAAMSQLENRLQALASQVREQGAKLQLPSAAKTFEEPIVYTWNSRDALRFRPTTPQIDELTQYAMEAARSQDYLESMASIMRFSPGQRAAFLEGRLTMQLSGLMSKQLWQLWHFLVDGVPIEECVEPPTAFDNSIVIPYPEPIATPSPTQGSYFAVRPMAPPPARIARAPSSLSMQGPMSAAAAAFGGRKSPGTPGSVAGFAASGLTPGMGAVTVAGGAPSPAPSGSTSMAIVASSPSIDATRLVKAAQARWGRTFNIEMALDWQQAGNQYLSELAERRVAIQAAERQEAIDRKAGLVPSPRAPEATYPDWPRMTAVPPVEGAAGNRCSAEQCVSRCSDGPLTECSGCGYSFHFDCCADKTRQPPGGDLPWYCGGANCKGSVWRTMCEFKPQPVPEETFECVVCHEELNTGLKCNLVGCLCAHERTCTSCVHVMLGYRQAEESFQCGVCKQDCTGIVRPGSDEPERIAAFPLQEATFDDERVELIVRRRRGTLTEAHNNEIHQHELQMARIESVASAATAGALGGSSVAAAFFQAQANDSHDISTLVADSEEPLDDDDEAAALAQARGMTTKRGAPKERGEPAAQLSTSPGQSSTSSEEPAAASAPKPRKAAPAPKSRSASAPKPRPAPAASMASQGGSSTKLITSTALAIDPKAIRQAPKKHRKPVYTDDEEDSESS